MKNKRNVMISLCVAILFMAVGYAAFSTALNISGTANIASEWKVVFTNIEKESSKGEIQINETPRAEGTSATFNVGLQSPGDYIRYTITVENQGTLDAIIENITFVDGDSSANDPIVFQIEGIATGDTLEKKDTKTFNVLIKYNENITTQPSDTEKSKILTVDIKFIQKLGNPTVEPDVPTVVKPLSTAILKNGDGTNKFISDAGINFNLPSSETNGRGLYSTSNTNITENGSTVYYFRGAVDNNYVKFGKDSNGNDLYWRIVRINEDGTIRMIYQGIKDGEEFTSKTIGTARYCECVDEDSDGTCDAVTSDSCVANAATYSGSTIEEVVENWYETNLKTNYGTYIDNDAKFCNDTTGKYNTRLVGNSSNNAVPTGPSFKCEGTTLTSGYGLLTADEAVFAGSAPLKFVTVSGEGEEITSTTNTNMISDTYIGLSTLPVKLEYWTMTRYTTTNNQVVAMITASDAKDGSETIALQGILKATPNNTSAKSVVPVINLRADVTVGTNGEGTINNPYVVQ